MKHRFEDIDKLKQLDRIEYMLKIKVIRDRWNYSFGCSIFWFVYFCSILLLILLGWYSAFHTYPIKILLKVPFIFKFFLLAILIDFLLAVYYSYQRQRFEKQVYEKFFKFEVKAK